MTTYHGKVRILPILNKIIAYLYTGFVCLREIWEKSGNSKLVHKIQRILMENENTPNRKYSLCQILKIDKTQTSPQSYGMVERFNHTILISRFWYPEISKIGI